MPLLTNTDLRKTNVYGELEGNIAVTYKGMAHFAGTGPSSSTCGGCQWHVAKSKKSKIMVCGKFAELMAGRGSSPPHVPSGALACKYYEKKEGGAV